MNIYRLITASLGLGNSFLPSFGGSAPSPAQQRRQAEREADAPRRAALAAEIAEWNSKVKRRNQRFVARQRARGRAAS